MQSCSPQSRLGCPGGSLGSPGAVPQAAGAGMGLLAHELPQEQAVPQNSTGLWPGSLGRDAGCEEAQSTVEMLFQAACCLKG